MTLDPTATTGERINLHQTQENEINSALQILDSRHIAEQVADKVGVENVLAGKMPGDDSEETGHNAWSFRPLGWLTSLAAGLDPESDRSRAVRKIQSSVEIWAPPNSSVVTIQCRAGDAKLAQQVAKQWTESFLKEHLRITRTQRSFEFFSQQVKALNGELTAAETKLRDAKVRAGLVSVGGQQSVLEAHVRDIRSQQTVNHAALHATQAKLDKLQGLMTGLSPDVRMEQVEGVSHQAWDRMREKLYELQIRERQLKSKYTVNNPDVIAVEDQRKEVEKILGLQPNTRSQVSNGPNPVYQAIQQGLLEEQAGMAALSAGRDALAQQMQQARNELRTLNGQVTSLAELERNVAILNANYRANVDNMEQARIHQALDNEHISSVNVLQPASFVEKPVSPQKLLTAVVGLLVAVFGGIGVALTAEYLDRSMSTPEEVEEALELPVLASIPRMSLAAVNRN